MSVSKKLKWRRSINELKFLYEELDLVSETCRESGRDFEIYYREYCARSGIDIGALEKQNKERMSELFGAPAPDIEDVEIDDIESRPGGLMVVDISEEDRLTSNPLAAEDKEIHEIFNKLFKKIACALHPDKVSSLDISPFLAMEMIESFKTAKKAYDERRYFVLIETAEQYGIYPPDNYSRQSKWFRRESCRIEALIRDQQNTYNYVFSECPDEEKDSLIRNFLHKLFGI